MAIRKGAAQRPDGARTRAALPPGLLALALLAGCGGKPGEEGTAFFLTEEGDLRDGFSHLCPAVTAARDDPDAVDHLLFTTAQALRDYNSGPAFSELARGLVEGDASDALARLDATLSELELTAPCSDSLLELRAMATTAELRALPGASEYVGRGFRVLDSEQAFRPWADGDYADVVADGGVALTHPSRSSLTRPFFASVTPVTASPDDCETHARAYLDARGLMLGAMTIERYVRTDAGAEPQRACMFFALPSEPHARVWGWLAPLSFGTFRIVCEGDDRADQGDYCSSVTTSLRPPTDGGAPDFTLRVPEWRKERRGPPTRETESNVPSEIDGSARECAWMRTPPWVGCVSQATTSDDLDRCDADDRSRRGFDDALCSRFAEHVAPLLEWELERTKKLCVSSWAMPRVECALAATTELDIDECNRTEWGP